MLEKRWNLLPRASASFFSTFPSLPPLFAQILYNRGIKNSSDWSSFSDGRAVRNDPFAFGGMQTTIERLQTALQSKESIAIFGDFDADGITSSSLLYRALSALGANLSIYIPHRVQEGHGLNMQAIDQMADRGASLIVTTDCGVTSAKEVEYANSLDMQVIIVDHHTPPPELPQAFAIIDPKLEGCAYPYNGLAAVGVVYKLVQALYERLGREMDDSLLELVALGTIADVAPLTGENRYLVREGLKRLNSTSHPGLRALMDIAGLKPGHIDVESISFGLGPRINAASRIDHGMTSFKLLTCTSSEEAAILAAELEKRNAVRQTLTAEALARARPEAESLLTDGHIIMVGSEDYPPGILGLIAGKLCEEFRRPAIAMHMGESLIRASARSIPEFSIINSLMQCRDLFIKFGGHPQAAGFTIASENLGTLRKRLGEIASNELRDKELLSKITIDAYVRLKSINGDVLRLFDLLGPFGQENPQPVLLSKKVQVLERRLMGGELQHFRMRLREDNVVWEGVAFGLGSTMPLCDLVDIVYTISANHWNGVSSLQLNILDIKPSA